MYKLKDLNKKELKEIIQSGHINLLIGSGCSKNYLDTLGNIEQRMDSDDESEREKAQKEYLAQIIKSKAILNETLESDKAKIQELKDVKSNYDDFIRFWTEAMSRRSLKIVNKQVNVFSTNFDMFFEDACERLNVPYNDGFAGQLKPVFDVGNFNKIQRYKSLQFDNTSDIPLFNIIKIHGSLSWRTDSEPESILYSKGEHLKDALMAKTGDDFRNAYDEQLAVINPNAEKHIKTVLNTNYASLLRKFTLELEKENSVLFVIGFSLDDEHIRKLLYSVMKTNPTLVVVYFAYSPYKEEPTDEEKDKNASLYRSIEDEASRSNFYVISNKDNGTDDVKQPFNKVTEYLKTILPKDYDGQSSNDKDTEIEIDEDETNE